jgi:hypothetical protein
LPDPVELVPSHDTLLVAVQAHPSSAVTATEPLPLLEATESLVGSIV